jgi:hypothetical protein
MEGEEKLGWIIHLWLEDFKEPILRSDPAIKATTPTYRPPEPSHFYTAEFQFTSLNALSAVRHSSREPGGSRSRLLAVDAIPRLGTFGPSGVSLTLD